MADYNSLEQIRLQKISDLRAEGIEPYPTRAERTHTAVQAIAAFEAAEKSGKVEELHSQLLELAKAQNKSTDGGTSIPATFMRVTVSL